MGLFETHTRLTSQGDGHFRATLDRAFEIWGPNGGYLSAIALRAAGRVAPAGHRPASITVQYPARADFGPAEVAVDVLKGGSAALSAVTMRQGDRRFLTAQVWTTDRSQGPDRQALAMPDVPPPDDLPDLAARVASAGSPLNPFWAGFDVRPTDWTTGRNPAGARTCQWFRYRDFPVDADSYLDAARALLLIDTLVWPAHNRGLDERARYLAPSLDVAAWFHELAASDWLLLDVSAERAGGGLIHGTARVWSLDGRLVATGASGLAVLPPRPATG